MLPTGVQLLKKMRGPKWRRCRVAAFHGAPMKRALFIKLL